MNNEKAMAEALAFLDPARTAIDHAELCFVAALSVPRPAEKLSNGQCMIAVAARNLTWCAEGILKIVENMVREQANGTSVDRVSTGRTVVSAEEMGRDSIPESASCTRERPA